MNIAHAQSPAPARPQVVSSSRPVTRFRTKTPAAVLLAALLTGCTLGPDFQRPDAQAPQQWDPLQGEHAPSQPVAEPIQLRWWDSFHDPRLSALIEQVATRNLDLQIASARLLQSRARLQDMQRIRGRQSTFITVKALAAQLHLAALLLKIALVSGQHLNLLLHLNHLQTLLVGRCLRLTQAIFPLRQLRLLLLALGLHNFGLLIII